MISLTFVFLVHYSPSHNVHIWFATYPANLNALFALVSFAVSGIYLSFFLTVIGAMVARARGWVPEGTFQLGKWGWTVSIAATYLGLMLINVIYPSGLSSGRELFNYDWITLGVIALIAVVGAIYFLIARLTGTSDATCTTRSSRPGRSYPARRGPLPHVTGRRQRRPVHLFV